MYTVSSLHEVSMLDRSFGLTLRSFIKILERIDKILQRIDR
jgi:hypothetical protein